MSHRQDETLFDCVQRHAQCGGLTAFAFLADGEQEHARLSFGALEVRARALAAELQAEFPTGTRVLLLFPAGLSAVVALLGCMMAGLVPVPLPVPHKRQGLEHVVVVARHSSAGLALTDSTALPDLAQRFSGERDLAVLPLRAVSCDGRPDEGAGVHWRRPAVAPLDTAFLQYTSGSTAVPKGVAVTHASLMANMRMIREAFGHGPETVFASWLPLHHDMGLVGNVLQPMFLGCLAVLMPPMAFMQRPLRWLQAISDYRATSAGGPNFAFDLCVSKIPDEALASLDLRSWTLAFNGAEPVRAGTLARFRAKFGRAGFGEHAFYPCYGMAEATLFVSGGRRGDAVVSRTVSLAALERHVVAPPKTDDPRDACELVGCGRPWGDGDIRIVDPETARPCSRGAVGEIWVRGTHIAHGYWNDAAATRDGFHARLEAQDDDARPFVRTGDLGFIDDGELFVTGRCKDLVIIRGRNLYPQDIEMAVAAAHEAFDGGGAAFGVQVGDEERLVVVQEVRRGARVDEALAREARLNVHATLVRRFDVQLHDLVLIRPRTLPRTTSGKTRRAACRALYREGRLARILEI